jgi:hypothetical protein
VRAEETGRAEARASRVLDLFRTTGPDLLIRRRSWWESARLADASFLVGMSASFMILVIEVPLWLRQPLPAPFSFWFSGRAAALLFSVLLVNGCFLDRLLAHWTDRRLVFPRGWIALRFLLATSPLFSFYAPALWRRFVARRTAENGLEARIPLDLTAGRKLSPPRATGGRRFLLGLLPLLWAVVGLLGPLLGAIWLGTEGARNPGWRRVALGASVLLHLGAAAAMGHYFQDRRLRSQAAGWRRALLSGLPVLWLLPLPALALGILLLPSLDARQDETLVTAVHWRRWNASRLALWPGLERSVLRRWQGTPWWKRALRPRGLERPARAGRAEKGLLALYRWKSLLLFFDGVALLWVLTAWERRAPVLAPFLDTVLRWTWWGSVQPRGSPYRGSSSRPGSCAPRT